MRRTTSEPRRASNAATRVIFRLLTVLVLTLSQAGCPSGAGVQARIADGIGVAANQSLPLLVDRYEKMGDEILQALKARGGVTAEEAQAAIQAHKDAWAPVWQAWESLRVAQNGYADALERGVSLVAIVAELRQAFCELREVWPEDIPAIPLAPVVCR